MNIFLFATVFIVTTFFYLHINYHRKENKTLDIFELGQVSKNEIDKSAGLRSPFLFTLDSMESFDELYKKQKTTCMNYEQYKKTKHRMPIEIEQSGLAELLQHDKYIRYEPLHKENKNLVKHKKSIPFDMMKQSGVISEQFTIIENNMNGLWNKKMTHDRNYVIIPDRTSIIRIAPSSIEEKKDVVYDHLNMNYYIDCNLWDTDINERSIELELHKNSILHIPKGWYITCKDGPILLIEYDSIMNKFSNTYYYFMYMLQKINTKTISAESKKIDIDKKEV